MDYLGTVMFSGTSLKQFGYWSHDCRQLPEVFFTFRIRPFSALARNQIKTSVL